MRVSLSFYVEHTYISSDCEAQFADLIYRVKKKASNSKRETTQSRSKMAWTLMILKRETTKSELKRGTTRSESKKETTKSRSRKETTKSRWNPMRSVV